MKRVQILDNEDIKAAIAAYLAINTNEKNCKSEDLSVTIDCDGCDSIQPVYSLIVEMSKYTEEKSFKETTLNVKGK